MYDQDQGDQKYKATDVEVIMFVRSQSRRTGCWFMTDGGISIP